MADVIAVKQACGVTINDVVLAITTGALRRELAGNRCVRPGATRTARPHTDRQHTTPPISRSATASRSRTSGFPSASTIPSNGSA